MHTSPAPRSHASATRRDTSSSPSMYDLPRTSSLPCSPPAPAAPLPLFFPPHTACLFGGCRACCTCRVPGRRAHLSFAEGAELARVGAHVRCAHNRRVSAPALVHTPKVQHGCSGRGRQGGAQVGRSGAGARGGVLYWMLRLHRKLVADPHTLSRSRSAPSQMACSRAPPLWPRAYPRRPWGPRCPRGCARVMGVHGSMCVAVAGGDGAASGIRRVDRAGTAAGGGRGRGRCGPPTAAPPHAGYRHR